MEKKKCHIHVSTPITCFSVPIVGDTELYLTHDEICKCICAKAEVTELLDDGRSVKLNFSNYNRDNSIIGEPIEEDVKEEIIVEEPVVVGHITEEEPVIEVAETITNESVDEETVITVEDSVEVEEEIKQDEEINEDSKEESENDTVKDYEIVSRNNNKKKIKIENNFRG